MSTTEQTAISGIFERIIRQCDTFRRRFEDDPHCPEIDRITGLATAGLIVASPEETSLNLQLDPALEAALHCQS